MLAQLKFRAGLTTAERKALKYRMWLWPLSSYLALAFLVLVVGLMAYFEDTRVALYIGPAFLVLLTVLYYALRLAPKEVQGVASTAS
ncbi:Proline-specific permease ProY [compost metagenome]